ncbi:MAG: hypothetical protein HDT47_01620 [Ruminococcaceae bacterium]|nr:hypothetical protein [Oscillospiraceae bacterium]
MRNKFIVFLILSILILFTSCGTAENTEEFSDLRLVKWGEGNRLEFFDLESLERCSEIVVVGTFIDDATQNVKYKYDDFFGKEILFTVKSLNTIEVTKAFKGDVDVGDTLQVAQEYAIVEDRLVTDSSLTPMMKGDTWLFFLNKGNRDFCFCTSDSDGRYPVKDFTYTRIALTENEDLGVYDKEDFKEEIYNEILEKYDLS